MIICLGPFCVPCWPIFFMILSPLWNLLPEGFRARASHFWDTKVYPNVIHPVLSRLPERVQKFLLWGIKRAKKKDCGGTDSCCPMEKKSSATQMENVSEMSTACDSSDSEIRKRNVSARPFQTGSVLELETEEQFREILSSVGAYDSVILDFSATWCKPCQAIKPLYKELAQQTENSLFCVVDADELQDIVDEYEVLSLPTMVKLSVKGDEAKNFEVDRLKMVSEGSLKTFVA